MPFGLINVSATFQRMMDEIFKKQLVRNLEVYVDDMIVKSKTSNNHCFLISQRGIEADPSQIRAISEMKDPSSIKEVQHLTGCIAALRRFIPQASKKCSSFFKVIKEASRNKKLLWDDQCKESFEAIKAFLTSPPVLARALPRETLKVYISASDGSVASVLVKDVEEREAPVYYVSYTLKDAETRYPHVEKLVYALVVASRKLCHYFQGRMIKVMTNQPLKRILHKPDMTGRLAAWTVELSQFHIEYSPRNAVKSQVLSDFDVECQFDNPIIEESSFPQKAWVLYVDGSSTSSSGGAGVILISPEGFKIQQALKFSFPVTNNVAEYEALLAGLRLAIELEVKILEIFGDSQLIEKQLQGEFKAHDARMLTYLKLAMSLLEKVQSWTTKNICREDNQWADALSKLASSVVTMSEAIYVEERKFPSIDLDSPSSNMLKVNEISSIADWHQPLLEYILQNKLPQDKNKARSISYKVKNYCVLENKLYRRGLVDPLLLCIGPEDSRLSMVEVHTGICGDHLGGKNLALKIVRQGLFWPTMRSDCEKIVRKCKSCQLYGSVSHQPSVEIIPVTNPCPFFQWGIDIVGPFPKSKNQAQYIVVAVDYATKWVEARPLAKIREKEMIEFFDGIHCVQIWGTKNHCN
ncbi:uncharacterized protein LOC141713906 [Apium graveolens]|uniref:uncharacterized protein LOC141713906 n=1 Tax=Apium graveolens TaxID=4045 RepID=UPI003D7B6C02